jgi:hypothetical protein
MEWVDENVIPLINTTVMEGDGGRGVDAAILPLQYFVYRHILQC